jgi:RNA polymerase sigma factor (sigma-70 family)
MKDHSPGSDERTRRPCWPAKKGRPDDSLATMPPSPLDPRHSPEPPDDAPAPPPRKEKPSADVQEKLFGDLQKALNVAKYRLLGEGFPEYFVLSGVDQAEGAGIDAMCGPLHDRMKPPPENMHPAAWRQWAYIAARNATVSLQRRKRMESLTHPDQMPAASTSSLDPHEQKLLLKAVQQLSPDDQALIDAVYYKGMSRRQYADLLHVGEATIRRRHDKAMCWLWAEVQRLSRSS